MEEDHRWGDPLLLTDVSCQQQHRSPSRGISNSSSAGYCVSEMAGLDPRCDSNDDVSWQNQSGEMGCVEKVGEPAAQGAGSSMLGFSLTSPDLVICAGSPDIPSSSGFADSPVLFDKNNYSQNLEHSVELSLENCIPESETTVNSRTPVVRFSTVCQTFSQVSSPESSFELPPPPLSEDLEMKGSLVAVQTNSGSNSVTTIGTETDGAARLDLTEDDGGCEFEGELQELVRSYKSQKKELSETRKAMEELKRENQLKSRECQEALKSLQELQNELMRKSMHVGSLAFAIEGQVKEKSKWFSSLRDLTRKLKILKLEQISLSEEASMYKKCLEEMQVVGCTIQSTIGQQTKLHEDLKIKLVEGAKQQKELYNKVLELKGNIRVFCRCRPLNVDEIAAGASVAIDFESSNEGELTIKSNGAFRRNFKFDAVFGPQADQADVFEDTAPFATSVLDGYNVCIFAYGQTGTGKTYTMEGTKTDRGVNYRTLEELFHIIKERQQLFQYDISVSVLEVYNEQIRDLLVPGNQPGVPAKSIHCVMVKGENSLTGECTRSKLWLVDLAGSERIAKTEVQGERLKEAQNINRSLSALGDVISALATKSPHVPFRNSKLTHLLQDSLGGDSKALMFVQISPNENDLSETICSLNFASRVKGVELGPAKKQLDAAEFVKYKQMVEKSKQDMKSKDLQIKKMEETIYCQDAKIKERDLKNKNLQDKIKELESQLLVERKLARQHVDTKIAEQQHLKQQEEQNLQTRPPLASRQLGSIKETMSSTISKDQTNLSQPFADDSSYKPPLILPASDGHAKFNDSMEKENIPLVLGQQLLPKRTGRFSICTTARQVPMAPAPRRNSLIPLPSAPSSTPCPAPLLPLQECLPEKNECEEGSEMNCLPEKIPCHSPKGIKSGGKKLSSALRRSVQKKMHMKSPMRKVGVNVGMEKVRVSIGNRGRIAPRMFLGSNRIARTKDIQNKQSQREKERGWNIGTAGRTVF
ncbi:hypothetical protein BT93_F2753 [Corymbia citriodora subsp. variegata]|nr:hypothetical protein BT93_F2753 [Corymbia citriodora subsp. variegata]